MYVRLPRFMVLISLLPFFVIKAWACSCVPLKTVSGAYEDSEIVVVVSLKRTELTGRVGQHRMLVEKVYKGNLIGGQEISISEGYEGACGKSFSHEKVGQRFLLFMNDPRGGKSSAKSKKLLFGVSVCSRSQRVEGAGADVEYLDNRVALAGKTRLSGRISSNPDARFDVTGIKVTISGPNIQRTTFTDEKGFFQFWDIPAGKYAVKYGLPKGWKIKFARSRTDADWTDALDEAVVPLKGHAEISTYVDIANEIAGKIFSPNGLPMEGACVSAYWLTPTTGTFMIPQACADKDGVFKLTDLLAGNYRLEVGRGTITSSNPFEKFYYPGVEKKEDAQVISVGPGVEVKDLVISVKKTIPLIKISGRLTFQDGRGFPEEPIRFKQSDVFRHERVETETDKDGNFSVTLPEGWTGHVSAETNIYESKFKKCEAVKKLRTTRKGITSNVPSNTINIDGQKSLDALRLIFLIPYCTPN